MPILFYQQGKERTDSHTFLGDLYIGSDPTCNNLVLPAASGIAPSHVAIIHAALNRQHVLVNLAGSATRVNRQPVISLKVLHQQDKIQLGQLSFTLWELCITRLTAGDPLVGKRCLICRKQTLVGEELIVCPRCSTPHHRNCGFCISVCANYTCEYPIRKSVTDALSDRVKLVMNPSQDSELVEVVNNSKRLKSGVRCSAGNLGDEVPFQVGDTDHIVFCPTCDKPFHLVCWLLLEHCPSCKFSVCELINEIFLINPGTFPAYNTTMIGASHARP